MTGMGKPGDQQTWVYQKTPDSWAAGSTGGGSASGQIQPGYPNANYSYVTSSGVPWSVPSNGGSFVGHPVLTASITTTGNPIMIAVNANATAFANLNAAAFTLFRNGVNIGNPFYGLQQCGPTAQSYNENVGIWWVEKLPAGTYTYVWGGTMLTGSTGGFQIGNPDCGPQSILVWEMINANVVTGTLNTSFAINGGTVTGLTAAIIPLKNPVMVWVNWTGRGTSANDWYHEYIYRNGVDLSPSFGLQTIQHTQALEHHYANMSQLDTGPTLGSTNTYTVQAINGQGSNVLNPENCPAQIVAWELTDVNWKYSQNTTTIGVGSSYTDGLNANPDPTIVTRGRPVLLIANTNDNPQGGGSDRGATTILRSGVSVTTASRGLQILDGEGATSNNKDSAFTILDVVPVGTYQYTPAMLNFSGSGNQFSEAGQMTNLFVYELDAGYQQGTVFGGWLDTGNKLSTTASINVSGAINMGGPLTIGGLPYIIPSGSVTVNTGSFGQVIIGYTPPISGSSVNTDETQGAGAAYGDLATVGPSVTLNTSGSVLINVCATAYKTSGAGNTAFISPQVSGASTVAAVDANASSGAATGTGTFCLSRTFVLTGLTPGLNTFTLKYKNDGGTVWHFLNRSITVSVL